MTSLSPADRALLRLLGERGGLLTAGEAASRTGCPLVEVENALLNLAVAGGADLRVSEDGDVAYRFAPQLRRRLLARSWRLRLEATVGWLWQGLYALIRISFGLVLVLLVAFVTVTLVVLAVIQLLRADKGFDGVLRLVWEGLELLMRVLILLDDGLRPPDAPARHEAEPGRGGMRSAAIQRGGAAQRLTFFEAVYSLLFGDGDPNRGLERWRWSRIGCFLQHRGGAVIAEDLAPLLDLPARPQDDLQAAEIADRAMLVVLQRFDGRPAVSPSGDLAFHFPGLQIQASAAGLSGRTRGEIALPGHTATTSPAAAGPKAALRLERPAPALRERSIPFSRATVGQRLTYGSLCITLLLFSPPLLALSQGLTPPLRGVAWFALGYGICLAVLPPLRLLVLLLRNRRIAARNRRRRSWSEIDPRHRSLILRKRAFACSFARRASLESLPLAYTTEQDLLTQRIINPGTD